MNKILDALKNWLLPVVLGLFLLQAVTLPFVVEDTWAGKAECPDYLVTYTTGKLVWDSATTLNKDGAARISLFENAYTNVQTLTDDLLVAPGTGGRALVRLKNKAPGAVTYKVVLYRVLDVPEMVLKAGFANLVDDPDVYPVPKGITADQVMRAVKGTLGPGEFADLDLNWVWEYEDGCTDVMLDYDEYQQYMWEYRQGLHEEPLDYNQDRLDTLVGDIASLDKPTNVELGLYIVVEDGAEAVENTITPTGGIPGTSETAAAPAPTDGTPGAADTAAAAIPAAGTTGTAAAIPAGSTSDTAGFRTVSSAASTESMVSAVGMNACVGACLALLLIAGVVFVLYVLDRRRKKNG